MTKRSSLFIFLSLFIVVQVSADPGFFPVGDARIPLKVQQASEGVFRLAIISSKETLIEKQVQRDHFHEEMEVLNKKRIIQPSMLDDVNVALLSKCSRLEWYYCNLISEETTEISYGTGFLLEDNKTIYTAAHNFYRFEPKITEYEGVLTQKYSECSILLTIDQNKKLIFDSRELLNFFYISFKGYGENQLTQDDRTLATLENTEIRDFYFLRTRDAAILKFSEDLVGKPFVRANSEHSADGPLYTIGYPVLTIGRNLIHIDLDTGDEIDRQSFNSNGHDLYYSQGQEVDEAIIIRYFLDNLIGANNLQQARHFSPDYSDIYSRINEEGLYFVNNDLHSGNSGGPLVNANGEVVGINVAVFGRSYDATPAFSVAIKLSRLELLRDNYLARQEQERLEQAQLDLVGPLISSIPSELESFNSVNGADVGGESRSSIAEVPRYISGRR